MQQRGGQARYWSLPAWSTVNFGGNSHIAGQMKALVLLRTQLDLNCLLIVSYTDIRPCCCHMLASSKHLYCTSNCVCVLYNKNPLPPLPLLPRFSLSCFIQRIFPHCPLNCPAMVLLISALPYPITPGSVLGLSEAAFRSLQLHVCQKCLDKTSGSLIQHGVKSRVLPHLSSTLSSSWNHPR